MNTLLTFSTVIFFSLISSARATKFAAPEDEEVKSPNGRYLLHINAKSGQHEVREGTKVLWSFKKDVWHNNYSVSNDGKHVLWVAWTFVKAEDIKTEALTVYSSEGVVLKKTYAELGTPRRYRDDEIGPIGDFWRIWRGKVTRKEEVISIDVEGREKPFEIDFSKIEELRKN
ncbi:MAG: hypothetical protein ACKO2G_03560 [Verrucomicrobiales bacterium]